MWPSRIWTSEPAQVSSRECLGRVDCLALAQMKECDAAPGVLGVTITLPRVPIDAPPGQSPRPAKSVGFDQAHPVGEAVSFTSECLESGASENRRHDFPYGCIRPAPAFVET